MTADTGITEGQQTAAVGCLTAVAGFFGGGMIAVLIGKWVGAARGCVPREGLPACDWEVYVGIGGLIGLIMLPTMTILALRRSRRRARTSERG